MPSPSLRRSLSAGISRPTQFVDENGFTVTYPRTPYSASTPGLRSLVLQRRGYASGVATVRAGALSVRGRLRHPAPSDNTLTLRRAYLSDYVYPSDTVEGYVNRATKAAPPPIANFVSDAWRTVGNSVYVEVVAFHREEVDCVVFTATDGTNSISPVTVSSMTVSPGAYDATKVLVYAATLDISSLANPGTVTVNARVYPKVGVAIADSSLGSSTARGFGPQVYYRSTALSAAPVFAYVDATSGNDATGVVSATAATASASPYQTLGKALDGARASTAGGKLTNSLDGVEIRLKAGSHTMNAATSFTDATVSGAIITAAPGESKATVTLTSPTSAVGLQQKNLRFVNVKLVRGGSGYFASSPANSRVFLENCALDNSAALVFGWVGSNQLVHAIGCSQVSAGTIGSAFAPTTTMKVALLRGNAFGQSTSATNLDAYNVVGNDLTYCAMNTGTVDPSNSTLAFNKVMACNGIVFSSSFSGTVNGIAFVQNLSEYSGTTNAAMHRPSGDADLPSINHLVMWHNTDAGFDLYGRANALYDDSPGTTRRTHDFVSVKHNIINSWNTKVDRFVWYSQANADCINRTGAWPQTLGVGVKGNHHRYRNASSGAVAFGPEDFGVNSNVPTTNTSPGSDPQFTSPANTTSGPTAGAGNGTYTLQSTSPARSRVSAGEMLLPFDLAGTARKNDGTGAAGAYEF